ncbi:hypothetical protein MBANPS3_004917 [Mucor bainieri]
MSDDEYEHLDFTEAAAAAPLTYPMQCTDLRKKGHVIMDGRPCEIISTTFIPETNEVNLAGRDIFTGKRHEVTSYIYHDMDVPNVSYQYYPIIDVDGVCLTLMLDDGTTKDNLELPGGALAQQIEADYQSGKSLIATVVSSMNEEHVVAVKEAPKS